MENYNLNATTPKTEIGFIVLPEGQQRVYVNGYYVGYIETVPAIEFVSIAGSRLNQRALVTITNKVKATKRFNP